MLTKKNLIHQETLTNNLFKGTPWRSLKSLCCRILSINEIKKGLTAREEYSSYAQTDLRAWGVSVAKEGVAQPPY